MKISLQLPLFLVIALTSPISVSAASITETYKQIDALRKGAEDDMAYVAKHGRNCTNNFDKLEDALNQTKSKVDAAEKALASGFSKILASSADGTCKAPALADVKAALRGIQTARDNLDSIVAIFNKPPVFFTTKTSHEIMLEAMAAADGYPNCIPRNRNDKNSTPESLAYQSFRKNMLRMSELLKQLDEDGGLKALAKNACPQANSGRFQTAAYQSAGGGSFDRSVDSAAGGTGAAY